MKIVKGVRVFEKRELIEKLSFSQEDAELVMKYQKKLPILLGNDNIDAKTLWEQLGKPQGQFNKWIKRKVVDKNFKQELDYFTVGQNCPIANGGYQEVKTYTLSIETAKHVSMMENTESGRLVRDYFIKMENALKDYEQWIAVREPQKESYKEMTKALDDIRISNDKSPNRFSYMNEADMINVALTGYTAKQIKEIMDYDDKTTRDHFNAKINSAIDFLQQLNIEEIYLGTDYQTRKLKINKICDRKYDDIKKYVNELKSKTNIA